jgi:pimeloyl-ACP methyl ester carboxylesterase
MEPFRRLPFADVPERPKKPHAYFESSARTIDLESAHFGKHAVHVREMGTGTPLLLIHGLMTTSYSWRYVMRPLSARFRVLAPDFVGCGRSAKPLACVYSARNLATWIGELQRAMDVRGCAVVGNSMGGYVARRLALDDPGAMRLLVDIHSPNLPEARYALLHGALAMPGAKALLMKMVHRDPLRWVHKNVHYWDESLKSLEEAHEYGDPLASREGVLAFAHFLEETMAPAGFREMKRDLEALATAKKSFPVPLKLIYARRDPMVSPKNGEQMQRWFPDAEFTWLEESSHFPQVDSPDTLVAELLRWCAV